MPNDATPRSAKRRDLPGMIGAVVFILIGLWVLQQTLSMSALGAVFPRAIAIAMIVFCVWLLIAGLRPGRNGRVSEEVIATTGPESTPRRLALVAIMAGWVLLLPMIGFLVTSQLAFLGILAVANYDRWTIRRAAIYITTSSAIVVSFYLLLVEVLLVPMPRGLLF